MYLAVLRYIITTVEPKFHNGINRNRGLKMRNLLLLYPVNVSLYIYHINMYLDFTYKLMINYIQFILYYITIKYIYKLIQTLYCIHIKFSNSYY